MRQSVANWPDARVRSTRVVPGSSLSSGDTSVNPLLDPPDAKPYRMTAATEPLVGYRLVQPLGQGGFGEVWQCEAPGGLLKAVKFVFAEEDEIGPEGHCLRQEFEAFHKIKSIRHPFLLTLERVELTDVGLVMVMELADEHLMDRFNSCRLAGQFGIPRTDLLGYLADAAEALDFMSSKHGLQHLDVKPANLFLIADHVKVGDYGLVARLSGSDPGGRAGRGLTPRYCAPEVARGEIDPRSDQYSLALVYQELLTGTFPFQGKSVAHMLYQHATGEPNLSGLPAGDRGAIRRALAKKPSERFSCCLDFVRELLGAGEATTTAGPRSGRLPTPAQVQAPPPPATPEMVLDPGTGEMVPLTPAPTTTSAPSTKRRAGSNPAIALTAEAVLGGPVTRLTDIRMVLPISRLQGVEISDRYGPSIAEITTAIVATAGSFDNIPRPGDIRHREDGSWLTTFPVRPLAGMVRLKLDIFRELWKAEILEPGPNRFAIVRRLGGSGIFSWLGKKSAAMEVIVKLPDTSSSVGEAEITGRAMGPIEPQLVQCLPGMVEDVRKHLQNFDDRRRSQRVSCDLRVTVFPVHRDGVLPAVTARCRNVSLGGFFLEAEVPLDTAYAYLAFDTIPRLAGWAVLTRFLRHHLVGERFQAAGKFRTER